MKLIKCLNILKATSFSIFVYPKGHVKENRGMNEAPIQIFDVNRTDKGKIIVQGFLQKYKDYKVKEIIPHSTGINIVVEWRSILFSSWDVGIRHRNTWY